PAGGQTPVLRGLTRKVVRAMTQPSDARRPARGDLPTAVLLMAGRYASACAEAATAGAYGRLRDRQDQVAERRYAALRRLVDALAGDPTRQVAAAPTDTVGPVTTGDVRPGRPYAAAYPE